jgi:L-methionine (R)-S-oxide reductase
MHVITSDPSLAKAVAYREIGAQLSGLFSAERNGLANTANLCALLYQMLPDVNWVGFYFLQGGELVLGPFQGKVACVRIPLGRGVCGTAAASRETLVVPDVNEFPGHIACDAASRSEIVVPLLQKGRLLGVLDLDSPNLSRFDHEDREGLEAAVNLLVASSELDKLSDQAISL